jgi:hypothetical protein
MKGMWTKYIFIAIVWGLASSFSVIAHNTDSVVGSCQQTWVNVFVHGIMSIKSHLTLSSFFRFLQDEMQNTIYAKTVDIMRQDPFFYQNQPMQEYGLHKAKLTDDLRGNGSYAMGWMFDAFRSVTGDTSCNLYYTYGWSGLLSCKQRYLDAVQFFHELENLVHELKSEGIDPKIRVIGYSHGGNVSLNLALARRCEYPQSLLSIDELILVGMPVQKETDYLICDHLFKKIYHFYSGSDLVQRLDVFCKDRYFSNRYFTARKGFMLPDKLTQIQLKITRAVVTALNDPELLEISSSFSNKCVQIGHNHLLRNDSPGHIELWFFGWTPHHYRESYTFAPLPTIAVAPLVIDYIQNLECKSKPYNPILVDIRPHHEKIVIKQKIRNKKVITVLPFITKQHFDNLKKEVCQFAPKEFTDNIYKGHMITAYNEAISFYEQCDGMKKQYGSGWLATRKRHPKNRYHSVFKCLKINKDTGSEPYFKF